MLPIAVIINKKKERKRERERERRKEGKKEKKMKKRTTCLDLDLVIFSATWCLHVAYCSHNK